MFIIQVKAKTYAELCSKLLEAAKAHMPGVSIKAQPATDFNGFKLPSEPGNLKVSQAPMVFGKTNNRLSEPKLEKVVHITKDEKPVAVISKAKSPVHEPNLQPQAISQDTELDADGIPWDSRIHAPSKAKTNAGFWRQKRNVPPALLDQVTNLYKDKAQGTPVPQTAPVAPLSQPVMTPPSVVPQGPTQLVEQPPEPFQETKNYDIPVPNHSAQAVHTFETFKQNFAMIITDLINQGKIDRPYIQTLNGYFQVKDIWDLAGDDTKLKSCYDGFIQQGFVKAP